MTTVRTNAVPLQRRVGGWRCRARPIVTPCSLGHPAIKGDLYPSNHKKKGDGPYSKHRMKGRGGGGITSRPFCFFSLSPFFFRFRHGRCVLRLLLLAPAFLVGARPLPPQRPVRGCFVSSVSVFASVAFALLVRDLSFVAFSPPFSFSSASTRDSESRIDPPYAAPTNRIHHFRVIPSIGANVRRFLDLPLEAVIIGDRDAGVVRNRRRNYCRYMVDLRPDPPRSPPRRPLDHPREESAPDIGRCAQ